MPIPNYDRQLLGQYIRSLENPDSIGFRDGKWYASPYDKNARGFGVDIVANKAAAKVAAGRPGRYLTEQEERDLRNAYIQTTQDTIDRQYHPYLRKQPLSDSKRVMATGLLYRGDSINMDKALSDAYYNGTDEDFQDAVTEYYKRKKLPERAKHHSKFFDKKQEGPATIKELEPPHVTQSFESMQYQPPMKFSDGGFLQPKDAWDALSMREKAAMLKVAVRNGITSLQDIRQKYNEFAEGGHLYGGTSEKSQKMERKGGYVPSDAIRKRIAGYEGKAMTGAIDPLSGRYARNNSFESEARGFYKALPESIRERVLSNPELADNLYSYSYNVGAGNFKSRVVPALERYYAGTGSADDVASSMWASGDRKLRGLRLRREQERNGVLSALWDRQMGELNQMIDNPQAAAPEQPAFMPYDLGNLFPVVPASDAEEGVQMPSEAELRRQQKDAERQERRDRLQNMMDALNMVYGSSPDNPMGSSGIFGSIGALMYDDGGRIHIKPENKGKFTALKKRTGHSATWFKENGTPAQKKMATFALNARHWKHGEGGNLFDTGGDTGDTPNIFRRPDGSYFYSADGTETDVTPINTLGDNPAYWTYADAAGKTYTPKVSPERHDTLTEAEIVEQRLRDSQIESNDNIWIEGNPTIPRKNRNPHLMEKAASGAGHAAGWMKDHPVLNDWGLALGATPFAVAAYPFAATAGSGVTALGDAAAATTVGQGITNFLAPVATSTIAGAPALEWADLGLTSLFGTQGINRAIEDKGISPMTVLDIAPLGIRTGIETANALSKLRKYSRLERNYAGVPHTPVKGGTDYMDEAFPRTHKKHTVWTSNDPDYARSGFWSEEPINTVFDVYYDPKELSFLETPKAPEGQMVYWQGLPYKFENGKVVYADNINITAPHNIAKNKELALSGKNNYGIYRPEVKGKYIEKDGEFTRANDNLGHWDKVDGSIKTDDVVKFSKDNNYDATTFHRVYDGGVDINGEYFDYPIDEVVFNPHAPKYVLPHGTPKWKVFNQLSNKYNQTNYPLGYISLPTLETRSYSNE